MGEDKHCRRQVRQSAVCLRFGMLVVKHPAANGCSVDAQPERDKTVNRRFLATALLVATLLCSTSVRRSASAATLVADPFVSPYSGWIDPDRTLGGSWRLNLQSPTPTLMDNQNTNPPTSGATPHDGTFIPHLLVQDNVTTGANYEFSATMRTNDDDLLGLVFNYQDSNNYFRAGIRQQPGSGNFGGTQGFSIQKVVGGVLTQIYPASPQATASPITQAMIDGRTPFDFKVAVTGTSFNVFFNGASQLPGGTAITDADLVAGRKVGFQSWAQETDTANTPTWGTEIDSVSLTSGGSSVFSQTFNNTGVKWRNLVMKNAAGISTPYPGTPLSASTTATRDDVGNFGLDINDRWIMQKSNGFENATVNNTDFIGSAIVVNEPGSASFSNYEMRVRIAQDDNDGVGVLVRVQDDNNYYRVNFTNEAIGTGVVRSPQGLSVQKVRNGVWTELFRDNQLSPQFVPSVGVPGDPYDWPFTEGLRDINGNPLYFDLSVKCVDNTLIIQVKDHLGNVINYAPIVDSTDPLLTGTVGLTTWAAQAAFYMNYGGELDSPLLVDAVPEPSAIVLGLIAAVGFGGVMRRRKVK